MGTLKATTDNEVHDSGNGSEMRLINGLSAPRHSSTADLDAALALQVLVVCGSEVRALGNDQMRGRGLGKRIGKAAA